MRTDPRHTTPDRSLRVPSAKFAADRKAPSSGDGSPKVGAPNADRGARGFDTKYATWRGRSGRLHVARIELLLDCRALARAAYVLVTRDALGRAVPLFVGLALSAATTLNLARIRHRAAKVGAKEVHIIDLTHAAGSYAARRLVRDLRASLAHAA